MLIRKISLKNFKNFKEKEVLFEPLTFIKGKNGSGKTTLALESILFCLYGYTPKESLKDLPTRNIATSCIVEIELKHKDKFYKIIRKYPTHLSIYVNNEPLIFTNSRDAQDSINNLFGDRLNFMKFRIIDSNIGANFLEEGQVALKKILFSMSDELFNNIRNKLNEVKHEREIYNKDKALVFSYYPSESRLETLEIGVQDLQSRLQTLKSKLEPIEQEHIKLTNQRARYSNDLNASQSQKRIVTQDTKCYACKRGLDEELKKKMLDEIITKIDKLEISMQNLLPEIDKRRDLLESARRGNDQITNRIYKIKSLITKLETRIKQKNYKYTDKDVLIVKKAIEELDKLSSYYITESLKILEPIINNIVSKIGFEVKFIINEKGKFAIELQKDNVSYNYKDLSCGQKLILQIGFKLALLLERGETGLIVADEGLSSLDEDNLNHIINLFKQFPFQLLFVLHAMKTKVCPQCDNKFDDLLEKCPNCDIYLMSLLENIKVINLDKEE